MFQHILELVQYDTSRLKNYKCGHTDTYPYYTKLQIF